MAVFIDNLAWQILSHHAHRFFFFRPRIEIGVDPKYPHGTGCTACEDHIYYCYAEDGKKENGLCGKGYNQ